MRLQKLYSYVRRALADYDMIISGDRVAVGISGGKDSLSLLYALAGLRRFYPASFEIEAITVDLGYRDFDLSGVSDLCRNLEVNYHIVKTSINQMIREGDCSLCARLRKGAFMTKVKDLSCNRIAYAHNRDDVVETMMMSLIYEGRFSTFEPVTCYEDNEVHVIRPLLYVPSEEVTGFCRRYHLPVVENPCPFEKSTERTYVRNLIREINHHAPDVKKRMMTAVQKGNLPGWNPDSKGKSPD